MVCKNHRADSQNGMDMNRLLAGMFLLFFLPQAAKMINAKIHAIRSLEVNRVAITLLIPSGWHGILRPA